MGLALTRSEQVGVRDVVIGDPRNPLAIVRVSSIRGDRVRLSVIADRGVPVHRGEIAARIAGDLDVVAASDPGTRPTHLEALMLQAEKAIEQRALRRLVADVAVICGVSDPAASE